MGSITDSHDSHDNLGRTNNLDGHELSHDVLTGTDNNCIYLNQSGRG
jgi:hypothetical protein